MNGRNDAITNAFRGIFAVQMMSMLVGIAGCVIDGMIIGRFLGEEAMAAFGFAGSVTLLPAIAATIFGSGAAVVCSRSLGKGSLEQTRARFSACFSATVVISALLAALIAALAAPAARLVGARGALSAMVADYIRGFGFACPGIILVAFLMPLMQMDGEMKRLLAAVAAMTVGDVAADLLNAFVFHGGMLGMALATAFSYALALGILLPHLCKRGAIFLSPRGAYAFSPRVVYFTKLLCYLKDRYERIRTEKPAPRQSGDAVAGRAHRPALRRFAVHRFLAHVAGGGPGGADAAEHRREQPHPVEHPRAAHTGGDDRGGRAVGVRPDHADGAEQRDGLALDPGRVERGGVWGKPVHHRLRGRVSLHGQQPENYAAGANPYAAGAMAFAFSMLSILLILGLCRVRAFSPNVVVLAGIAVGALWTAATTLLQFYATDVGISAAVIWNFGDLGRATYRTDWIMLAVVALGVAVFLALAWRFNALLSGEAAAAAMGVNVGLLRFVALLLASMITAVCVSFLGVIGFVGIICPHVTKRLLGQDHRVALPVSALCGSLLLLAADDLSRSLGNGSALPVGAITSLLGAPFFVAVVLSGRGDRPC